MSPKICILLWLIALLAVTCVAQTGPGGSQVKTLKPATILRDVDGNLLTDPEFVDIRMANFHLPDATVTRTLDDGTRELTTAKVPQEGTQAPDFEVRLADGTSLTLSQLQGKVVVLNFWFIGCPACEEEAPKLFELREKFKREPGVVFVSMTGDRAEAVKRYMTGRKSNYIVATDAADALESFTFGGYPKNIVISKDGHIVYWRSTVKAWSKFESVIKTELAKDAR